MSTKSVEMELNHDVAMFKKYKNLLSELTRKNVKLKYRNSWLGIFWSFLQPLLNMIVLSVVFGSIFGRSSPYIVCYPVWLFSGRLLYEFFNTSTTQAMTSFRRNAAIIKKVYVPKYMYPLSSVLSSFVNFAISMICYVCVWVFFKITGISGGAGLEVTWHFLFAIVPMFLLLVLSTGVGLILSVLAVYFRDVEYIYQVLIRLMMYLLPIIYPLQKVAENSTILPIIIKINPLYSMIELFRQCVLYGMNMSWKMLLYAFVTSTVVLVVGMLIFNWKSDDIIYHL
ncbi:MAG: ABC transporter permease [Eubacterium sp.]